MQNSGFCTRAWILARAKPFGFVLWNFSSEVLPLLKVVDWYAGGSRPDTTRLYLQSVMADIDLYPPTFDELPDELPLLSLPLPLIPHHVQKVLATFDGAEQLASLAVSTDTQPALALASAVSFAMSINPGFGEHTIVTTVHPMLSGLMAVALDALSIPFERGGDKTDFSGATSSGLRPDDMLFIRGVLLYKV